MSATYPSQHAPSDTSPEHVQCAQNAACGALWDALRDVTDPEIPISVVDMGLIVDLAQQDGTVYVKLTFTAMGCPATEFIMDDIRVRLLREPGVEAVRIEVVWDPVWTKARLSEEGIEIMRSWGISA